MTDLDQLAEMAVNALHNAIVRGRDAEVVLAVAPELIAVARNNRPQHGYDQPGERACGCARCLVYAALDAKLAGVFDGA